MFVQKIFVNTTREKDLQKVIDSYDASEAPGEPSIWFMRDRDRPNAYVISVAFNSREDANRNNRRPETQAFAEGLKEVVDGDPVFYNLDLISMS